MTTDNRALMARLEALGPVRPTPVADAIVRRLVADQPDADLLLEVMGVAS